MLANAFKECQSPRSMLDSTSFKGRLPPYRFHARLVSRQSFPHLWKKLWKIDGIGLLLRCLLAEMNLWDEILARIESKVNRHSFYTWFRPTPFVADDRSALT